MYVIHLDFHLPCSLSIFPDTHVIYMLNKDFREFHFRNYSFISKAELIFESLGIYGH